MSFCRPLRSQSVAPSDEQFLSGNKHETGDTIEGVVKLTKKLFDLSLNMDLRSEAWRNVKLSIEKRHNGVHPKSGESLLITDEEWK